MKHLSLVCLVSLIFCGVLTVPREINSQSREVPPVIKELVFNRSGFAEPIIMQLPPEDSRETLNQIKTTRFGLMPIFLISGASNIDQRLGKYLLNKGRL